MSSEYILRVINVAVCLVAAIHITYASIFDCFILETPASMWTHYPSWGGKFKFLTVWNECIEAVYFCFAVVDNLVSECGDNDKKPLRKIRDYWFMSIVFPLSFFVSFTFWVLFLINRELVMPKAIDAFFPWWLNHSVHTCVLFYSFLELITTYHKTTSAIRKQCYGLWTVTGAYLIWCNVVFLKSNMWVYPVLNELNWPGRILFFAGSIASATVFLYFGYHLNNSIWKKKIKSKSLQINS